MVLWEYGRVKTTVEIPDELFREAKATAARRGTRLKDLMADGLRLALGRAPKARRQARFPIISAKQGAPKLTATKVKAVLAEEAEAEALQHARPRGR